MNSCTIEETAKDGEEKISFLFKLKAGKADARIVLYDLGSDKLGKAYWEENEQIAKKWLKIINDTF